MNNKDRITAGDFFEKGKSKICVSLMGETDTEILNNLENILKHRIDILEWRADYYKAIFNVDKCIYIISKIKNMLGSKPLLFTVRTAREGGKLDISATNYKKILLELLENANIDMIDVEYMMGEDVTRDIVSKAHLKNKLVIGSNHDFDKTPDTEEIYDRLAAMKKQDMDVSKIAVMPESRLDVLRLLEATARINEELEDIFTITMSMGKMGSISRVAGCKFGSVMTFGAVDNASAPGQIDVEKLYDLIREIEKI